MTVTDLAAALGGRRSGDGWMACCPAHDDRNPSLSLTERNGRILVHCHAGCSQEAVIDALRARGLWPEAKTEPLPSRKARSKTKRQPEPEGPIVAEYVYTDEAGRPLFRVTRHEPKTFRQWRPDGKGGWIKGLAPDTRIVPYRLREVVEAPIVFIVEGEKDVETLRSQGFVATCNPGGAGKWKPEYAEYFRGKTCVVIPDTDRVGRLHGAAIVHSLEPVAAQVIIVDLRPDGAKDVDEWFEAAHSEVELLSTIETVWKTEEEVR